MSATAGRSQNAMEQKINITVRGHKVTLLFPQKPNPEIAVHVKQALMGTYMMATKAHGSNRKAECA